MTVDTQQPLPMVGCPDMAYINLSDCDLAEYIQAMMELGHVKSAARAVTELDRRLNRS